MPSQAVPAKRPVPSTGFTGREAPTPSSEKRNFPPTLDVRRLSHDASATRTLGEWERSPNRPRKKFIPADGLERQLGLVPHRSSKDALTPATDAPGIPSRQARRSAARFPNGQHSRRRPLPRLSGKLRQPQATQKNRQNDVRAKLTLVLPVVNKSPERGRRGAARCGTAGLRRRPPSCYSRRNDASNSDDVASRTANKADSSPTTKTASNVANSVFQSTSAPMLVR